MDLLEIRKKAKERKASEEAAGRAAVPEVQPAPDIDAVPDVQAETPRTERPQRKRKKKAIPKPGPASAPEAGPDSSDAGERAHASAPPAPSGESTPPSKTEGGDDLPGYLSEGGPSEEDIVEYLAFMLGREEYAVRVEGVREIIRLQRITDVPRAPGYVKGIISLRGVIIPVFDIKERLGLGETEETRTTRIIVVSEGGSPQGVMVDRVTGVARLKAGDMEPTPAVIGGVDAEYLEGVGRLGDRLLILFNASKILAMEGQAP